MLLARGAAKTARIALALQLVLQLRHVHCSVPLSDETLELTRMQAPQPFATAILSAPRKDAGAALRTTLAGLLNSGVHEVHLTWGRLEKSGRVPAHVFAIIKELEAAHLNRVKVYVHMLGRELWIWYEKLGRRCAYKLNTSARSNLQVAAGAVSKLTYC